MVEHIKSVVATVLWSVSVGIAVMLTCNYPEHRGGVLVMWGLLSVAAASVVTIALVVEMESHRIIEILRALNGGATPMRTRREG